MDLDVAYTESPNWHEDKMLERFAWLRENDPVHWSEKDELWLIANFEDVSYVSKHQEIFTSQEGVRPEPLKIGLIDEAEPRHARGPASSMSAPRHYDHEPDWSRPTRLRLHRPDHRAGPRTR